MKGSTRSAARAGMVGGLAGLARLLNAADTSPHLGTRRELFVDDWLVDRFEGDAARHVHKPWAKRSS